MVKREDILSDLENLGVEFKERENQKEVIVELLNVLKKYGVVYAELPVLFGSVEELFKSQAKL